MRSKVLEPPLGPPPITERGLFRTVLAGRGRSLEDAFANLRVSPLVSWKCEFPERNLFGARVALDSIDGEGHCDFLQIGDSIYVVIENYLYAHPRLEFIPGDDLLSFHVRLAGALTISVSRAAPVQVAGPSLLVMHQPSGVDASEWQGPGSRALSVTLYCRPDFIKSGLIAQSAVEQRCIERFLIENTATIRFCQLPVSSDILIAAASITSTPYDGRLRLIHMESKALELYRLILSGFDRMSDTITEQYSADELKRLHRARDILKTRFNPVPTIVGIARELGMNESKLKRGFKALFGKTVFDYGQECRMHHAMRLLRDGHMRIGLVAEAVGYTHQTTFASAFKQYFGYRPKEICKLPIPAQQRHDGPPAAAPHE